MLVVGEFIRRKVGRSFLAANVGLPSTSYFDFATSTSSVRVRTGEKARPTKDAQ